MYKFYRRKILTKHLKMKILKKLKLPRKIDQIMKTNIDNNFLKIERQKEIE